MRARAGRHRQGTARSRPTFEHERRAIGAHGGAIVGIDEAGRGPLAGPVVAAAVILDPRAVPAGLDDSKALDKAQREALYDVIKASAVAVGIGVADVARIDSMNILRATLWAMAAAVGELPIVPRLALVDGNQLPMLPCETQAIVRGDATCASIAAASIIAKVTRDRLMVELAQALPGYGFERHMGYPTPEHRAALQRLGASPQHRRSFRPVRAALGLE